MSANDPKRTFASIFFLGPIVVGTLQRPELLFERRDPAAALDCLEFRVAKERTGSAEARAVQIKCAIES